MGSQEEGDPGPQQTLGPDSWLWAPFAAGGPALTTGTASGANTLVVKHSLWGTRAMGRPNLHY